MKIHYFSWNDVFNRLEHIPNGKLYGIPRGGAVVAGLTGRAVDTLDEADVIVDDIVDSGATRRQAVSQNPNKHFWALVDKPAENLLGTWIVFPWEKDEPASDNDAHRAVVRLIQYFGENPKREGLLETPRRVISAFQEFLQGYQQNPSSYLKTAFSETYDEMVVLRQMPFWSLCEHHLMPFHGVITVAYIPTGQVVGISKLARVAHAFARRLQVQERLTNQIAECLQESINPCGAAVLIKARHLCMEMRGVKTSSELITSKLLGFFKDDEKARAEFLALAR